MIPKKGMGAGWFMKRWAYTLVALREASSFFVGFYLIMFIGLLYELGNGQEAYEGFIANCFQHPNMVPLHVAALLFALLHTITWFNLTPKAMVVWRGDEKLPDAALVLPNYIAWLAFSGLVLFLVFKQ